MCVSLLSDGALLCLMMSCDRQIRYSHVVLGGKRERHGISPNGRPCSKTSPRYVRRWLCVCLSCGADLHLTLTLFINTHERYPRSFQRSQPFGNCSLIPLRPVRMSPHINIAERKREGKKKKKERCLDANSVVDVVGRIQVLES